MEDNLESRTTATADSGSDAGSSSSTLAYDKHFVCSAPGLLTLIEVVFGLLVWMLIGGTEYLQVAALSWVMCGSVVCWVLTVCQLLVGLTSVHTRFPQLPWNTLVLCFNSIAAALYTIAALVDAASITQAIRGRHSYNSWMASTIFAFLVAICYASNAYLSFRSWKNQR
ncbi:CKLF-like MARVEL transmembrane domain-containing protein 8 [Clupea harengus]|uniref:CKLF-like MARVEL transmembrane domain-containing protein 8 n=1 Tax=Clupea harengus TaxID=7950 RepID=A0A8M1KLL4_CLUHA|nr:CKLF-like MARVEL transmembrane domain-containing protein 8 [Clupea harengus]